jgi:hypothetical protein
VKIDTKEKYEAKRKRSLPTKKTSLSDVQTKTIDKKRRVIVSKPANEKELAARPLRQAMHELQREKAKERRRPIVGWKTKQR